MKSTHEKQGKKPVGLTKDVGFQIGVRRTLPISRDDAWQLLTSKRGVKIWLGDVSKMKFNKGEKLALEVLPTLGFQNITREKFVDYSAIFNKKRVSIEVKYRKKISNSVKVTKKQLNEADFILIINEKRHKLIHKSQIRKNEITD